MAEIKEFVSDDIRRKRVCDALDCICKCAQPQFTNSLSVEFEWSPSWRYPILSIFETRITYWFGIIPRRRYRRLFTIELMFFYADYHKEIDCFIYDYSLFDIAKKKMQELANFFQADTVNFTKDFKEDFA